MFQKLIYLALAGAAGTLVRYWLSGIIQRNITIEFPFGTAIVNLLGCLVFGILWAFLENRLSFGGQIRTIIFVGFFGAFTTFSALMFETAQLMEDSQWLWASGNIILQNILGLVGIIVGLAIGRFV